MNQTVEYLKEPRSHRITDRLYRRSSSYLVKTPYRAMYSPVRTAVVLKGENDEQHHITPILLWEQLSVQQKPDGRLKLDRGFLGT